MQKSVPAHLARDVRSFESWPNIHAKDGEGSVRKFPLACGAGKDPILTLAGTLHWQAGMRTARLDEIIRQKDPALKSAVEFLAAGNVTAALDLLQQQGRVREIPNAQERIRAIAKSYVESPNNTLIVSPDNASRRELNVAVRQELKASDKMAQAFADKEAERRTKVQHTRGVRVLRPIEVKPSDERVVLRALSNLLTGKDAPPSRAATGHRARHFSLTNHAEYVDCSATPSLKSNLGTTGI